MNVTHTRGPWKFDKVTGAICATVYLSDTDGSMIAMSQGICHIIDSHRSKKNAKLIAAAPDLLEALVECHASLGERHKKGEGDFRQEMDVINAALRKCV